MGRAETAIAAALLLSGCSLAPNYHRPDIAIPAAYMEVPSGWTVAAPAADAPTTSWWEAFNDPMLTDLEGRIDHANFSLAAALARYDESAGALGVSRADLFPQVSLGASASRDAAPAFRPLSSNDKHEVYNEYQFGPSLSWEIDLFGRVRNSIAASKAKLQARAADVAGVRLALQTNLADTYFQMRGLDAREQLLQQTQDAYQKAYDLTVILHTGGDASGLDTSRARNLLSTAKAELFAVHAQRAGLEHAIAVLVGQPASGFKIAPDPRELPAPSFPTGTPSALLQRRPDIDAAERDVAAANAEIGVARAALYPSLSLGGSGGFETTGPGVLAAENNFWALGPASLALSLFDGGARESRVDIARAKFEEAADNYKETVLSAFKEVEDVLATGRDLSSQIREERDAAEAAERTRDLALARYRNGAVDYLEVVTAQTSALDAERALLDLQTRQLTTAVDCIRALGGPVSA